ncbi:MAG: sodium-dependent transporter [Treponema sp.]|nr:sodium-dependent transporter [Treponema sp.]
MEREKFSSRLGFILLSAGCAIGLGNVWRFPWVTGEYGGALFVLIYLVFVVILGLPVMTMEFAVGRASQKSAARSFHVLEKPGQKWHLFSWAAMGGNYILMMFYTTICGFILGYTFKMVKGDFIGVTAAEAGPLFGEFLSKPGNTIGWMLAITIVGFIIVGGGLQKSVEKVINTMMIGLFIILVILMIRALTLPGAAAGVAFYLKPNLNAFREFGFWRITYEAMAQAAFTLSLGIGSMAIFGSYIKKDKRLMGDAITVTGLDTLSAIMAGFVIFPACFAFGVSPNAGAGLIFVTLPPVFNTMPGGSQLWGGLFFILMTFAGLATTVAVFENIMSFAMDIKGWSRKKSCIVNCIALCVLALPCALGWNLWSSFQPLGDGDGVLGLLDFIVSNNLLPLGIVVYILFCVSKKGWGWENFIKEANSGEGIKFPTVGKFLYTWILPIFIIVIFIMGYIGKFGG